MLRDVVIYCSNSVGETSLVAILFSNFSFSNIFVLHGLPVIKLLSNESLTSQLENKYTCCVQIIPLLYLFMIKIQ